MAQLSQVKAYKLEDHVNDWVKAKLDELKLKNQKDYYTESGRNEKNEWMNYRFLLY